MKVLFFLTLAACGMIGQSTAAFWNSGSPARIFWAPNCDWNDQDLNRVQAPGEACGRLCRESPLCSHFSWNNFNGGTCWLKQGSISQNQAIAKPGVTCGIDCMSGVSNCSGI